MAGRYFCRFLQGEISSHRLRSRCVDHQIQLQPDFANLVILRRTGASLLAIRLDFCERDSCFARPNFLGVRTARGKRSEIPHIFRSPGEEAACNRHGRTGFSGGPTLLWSFADPPTSPLVRSEVPRVYYSPENNGQQCMKMVIKRLTK